MKNCQKCGSDIPATIVIDGKRKNLKNRKYCFDCSPFGQHNTKTLNNISEICICESCNKTYEYRSHAVMSRTKCASCVVTRNKKDKRNKIIDHYGGACLICGYKAYTGALEFHHLDPNKKDFNVSLVSMSKSIDSIFEETDKCILVCANCHREIHAHLISITIE